MHLRTLLCVSSSVWVLQIPIEFDPIPFFFCKIGFPNAIPTTQLTFPKRDARSFPPTQYFKVLAATCLSVLVVLGSKLAEYEWQQGKVMTSGKGSDRDSGRGSGRDADRDSGTVFSVIPLSVSPVCRSWVTVNEMK